MFKELPHGKCGFLYKKEYDWELDPVRITIFLKSEDGETISVDCKPEELKDWSGTITKNVSLAAYNAIKDTSGNESFHINEDEFKNELLRAIAEGRCEDVVECCKIATKLTDINIERWYV